MKPEKCKEKTNLHRGQDQTYMVIDVLEIKYHLYISILL